MVRFCSKVCIRPPTCCLRRATVWRSSRMVPSAWARFWSGVYGASTPADKANVVPMRV